MAEPVSDCAQWVVEPIPDEDFVYIRVFIEHFDADSEEFHSPAFVNRVDENGVSAMSSDWSKYGDPVKSQAGGRREPQSQNYHVLSLSVSGIRGIIPFQEVVHAPICGHPVNQDNRAHTNIFGPKNRADFGNDPKASNRVKMAFANCVKEWKIKVPASK